MGFARMLSHHLAATASAALRITLSTACGCDSIGTWLERNSTVVAMRVGGGALQFGMDGAILGAP